MADYSGFDVASQETNFVAPQSINALNIGGTIIVPIYRSFVSGAYVYTVGAPADGSTDTVVVGYQ